MPVAEHHAGDHVAERDVGGGGDRPAVGEHRPLAQHQRAEGVDARRAGHAADRRDQRCGGLLGVVERAAGQRRLPDLLAGDGEEEGHEDVVDQEVQRQVPLDHVARRVELRVTDPVDVRQRQLDEVVVALGAEVGPEQCCQCAEDEECGVLEKEPDRAFHALPPFRMFRMQDPQRGLEKRRCVNERCAWFRVLVATRIDSAVRRHSVGTRETTL